MFRLRRLYLDSIGVPENRFSDLTVDLTGLDGQPTDAIVWLRNGAGKTTMLSLLLALVLPDRRDFLATRTKKRTLEDLVQGGDTAHVVAEWVDPSGRLLLTGAVYEWDGRVRPRDYNDAGKTRLRRSWWCVEPDPVVDGSTLDELPFTLRTGGSVDRDRFRAHVRDLATRGVNAVVADQTLAEWHAALRERRFDPDLFRYFTEVNAAEGGIDGLFSGIDSAGAFVRYLLRFVADARRTAPVRELLAQTAVEIAKRPVYDAERDFCRDASPKIEKLGAAHTTLQDSAAALRSIERRASLYKAALVVSREAALLAERSSRARASDLDEAYTRQRSAVEAARRRRDEYRRRAAELLVVSRKSEATRAAEAVRLAEADLTGWSAVEELVALQVAQAELDTHKEALETAAEGALPLVHRVEQAKAALAAALRAEIEAADAELTRLGRDRAHQEGQRASAQRDQQKAQRVIAELGSELELIERRMADFERDRSALVEEGAVGDGERLDVAVARLARQVEQEGTDLDRVQGEVGALTAEIEKAQRVLAEAQAVATAATGEARVAGAEADRMRRRAVELADRSRLRELLQAEEVDLATQLADAVDALARSVAELDTATLDEQAGLALDERAVAGLIADGLLPPRPEVARIVELLNATGTAAQPGWRYLAEHVPAAERLRVVAERPGVVDGVVVYGDPGVAAATVDAEVDEVIVVAHAADLARGGEAAVVLGPAAARYDHAAADAELVSRRARLTQAESQVAALVARRQADAQLRAELLAFEAELPDGGMATVDARRAAAEAARDAATAAEERARAADVSLRARFSELCDRAAELRAMLQRDESARPRVASLAERERDDVEPSRTRRAAIPDLQRRARRVEDEAQDRWGRADVEAAHLRDAIAELTRRAQRWASELAALPSPSAGPAPLLEVARAAVDTAEAHLREQFREPELRGAVTRAEQRVRHLGVPWNARTDEVRHRAEQLATSPAATDPASRVAALAEAQRRHRTADTAANTADLLLKAARTELEALPTGRARPLDDVESPRDHDHALHLAALAEEEASAGQLEVGRLERERDDAGRAAGDAATRAGMLRDQAALLRQVDAGEPDTVVVPDDAEAVREAVGRLTASLDAGHGALTEAEARQRAAVDELRGWASQDRFATVADDEHGMAVRQLRDMFTGTAVVDRVAPHADELTADLEVRHRAIGQQLEQVETHKQHVVTRLADLVQDALGVLGRASRLSELPEGIGPWAHRPFLTVDARRRPSREQVELRVGELVDRMVRGKKIEIDADELLWRAVEASVVDGFTATVLKPAPDQPTARTPVEEMQKWSGGENLTASLVLFCVLARLRAEQRSGTRGDVTGGVVPLDNPLGEANYLPFLDLQRRVARANGVQLVFWTGIGDLGAVTTFPRIAAMHKRASTTRPGRAYVQVDAEHSQRLDVASAVRRDG